MQSRFHEIDETLRLGDAKRAGAAITKALKNSRDKDERAELLIRRARARLLDARPDEALEDLETGLALLNTLPSAEHWVLKGDILFARFELAAVGFADRNDAVNALHSYDEAIKHGQQTAWVRYQMGRILWSEGQMAQAVEQFSKTLALPAEPSNIHALACERLGFIALIENRQPTQALAYFTRALELSANSTDVAWLAQLNLRISRAHLEMEHHEAALNAARRALKDLQSTAGRMILPEAHLALAEVLAEMNGHETEAIEHYLRFLQSSKRPPGIDVRWSKVHEAIGGLSFRLERYQEAINAYLRALELNPYHPWEIHLRYQIARCCYRMRLYEGAIESVEKIQAMAATDGTPITDWRIFNLLGNAYFALEHYQAAMLAYRRAVELAPPTDSLEKTLIYLRFSEELSGSQA